MVIWTFDFLRKDMFAEGGQKISYSRTYKDGKFIETRENQDMNTIFLAYLTLFPGREIVKIRLTPPYSTEYAINYLEKRFIDHGLIGVLTVEDESENKDDPFNWGGEDLMAQYIFGHYFERVLVGELCSSKEIVEFREWIDEEIADFYSDYTSDREKYILRKQKTTNFEPKSQKNEMWDKIDTLWEFQLINEFGIPLTNILRTKNGQQQQWGTDEEMNNQNISSMTISVLKTILDQSKKKMLIDYFKVKLPNEDGFYYVFFQYFEIEGTTIVLLLSAAYYDREKLELIQIFKGTERNLLESISIQLKENPECFADGKCLIDAEAQNQVNSIVLEKIKKSDLNFFN